MEKIVRVAEKCYNVLHSDTNEQKAERLERESVELEVHSITMNEVRNALKRMCMIVCTCEVTAVPVDLSS